MSDDEEVMHSEEESEEEEEESSRESTPERNTQSAPVVDSGPSEAERAMQRRRAAQNSDYGTLDEEAQELLADNAEQRQALEDEIEELRQRREQRKQEREEEEKQLAIRRQEEEARRKKEEEERTAKKKTEDADKMAARAEKMAEFEKWKNTSKPNFIISKRTDIHEPAEEDEEGLVEKKSKEQLEAEKVAILAQRTPKLEIAGFDSHKLTDKAKELHNLIMRLESEKYDLEKRFKAQQYDMMELAERARSMNKVGKGAETLKRVQMTDEVDKMSEMFAGCPSKIVMYSQFERQKDPRGWGQRQTVFTGAHFLYAAAKIAPTREVKFNPENGLPEYEDIPGAQQPEEVQEEEE